MTDFHALFALAMAAGALLLALLALVELLLYYHSHGVIKGLRGRIPTSWHARDYLAESALSLVSLAMTAMLNVMLLLFLLLCFAALLYSIFYMTRWFPVVLAVVVAFLILASYICIRLACVYNRRV